jgi:predicted nucleic acid-binding protein
VYVDAQSIIYSVETHAVYWPLLQPLWRAARRGDFTVVSSELTLLEVLIGPLRRRDASLVDAYEQLFQAPEVRLLPITQLVLLQAARLRAGIQALRTPDALHAATSLLSNCVMFCTNDRGFQHVPGLPVTVLDDRLSD